MAEIENAIGALLLNSQLKPAAIPVLEDDGQDPKVVVEAQLPPYPINTTAADGKWQSIGNTR